MAAETGLVAIAAATKAEGLYKQPSIIRTQVTVPSSRTQSPPNGGLLAWLQVLGGFCIFLNTWGIMNSFGAFQAYYQSSMLASHSASQISWIGSVQAALLFVVSALTGPLYDLGYMRHLVVAGSILTVLGMMLTSICNAYWQFLLTQGVMIGVGNGCLFLIAITNIGQYFTTRKALATGIAATAGNIGGIAYPIMFNRLLGHVGFGWATRSIGFVMLAASLVPIFGLKQRMRPKGPRKLFNAAELKDAPFIFLNLGAFFGFIGIYVVFFYIQVFADDATPIDHTSPTLAGYLIAILNAGGVLGRLLPNLIADKIGYLNMQTPFAAATALLAFCWPAVHTVAGVTTFAPIYAFTAGAFSTFGPTVAHLSPRLEVLGTRMGMNLFVTGLGVLIGPPIAGAILSAADGKWIGVQMWCGATVALATLFMAGARLTSSPTRQKVATTFPTPSSFNAKLGKQDDTERQSQIHILSNRGQDIMESVKGHGSSHDREPHPQDINLAVAENLVVRSEVRDLCARSISAALSEEHFSLPSTPAGNVALNQALASFINQNFQPLLPITNHQVTVGTGVASCLTDLCNAICDPGDALLVLAPYWSILDCILPSRSAVKLIPAHLQDWRNPTAHHLLTALQDASSASRNCRIRGLLITNPSNPVGHCYDKSFLETCLRFVSLKGIHLISDEIYAMTARPENGQRSPFTSILSIDYKSTGCDPRTIHALWSPSKDLGLSGIRLGCSVVQSTQGLTNPASVLAHNTVSCLSAVAVTELLQSSRLPQLLSLSRERLATNYDTLTTLLRRFAISYLSGQAGVFVFVRIAPQARTWKDEEAAIARLADSGLLVSGGQAYHVPENQKGWVRVCIAIDPCVLQEACARLLKTLTASGEVSAEQIFT